MNVTKEVISDLFPLYIANECSVDSRALVEQYLRQNPGEAEQLKRVMSTSVLNRGPELGKSEEVRALCRARSRLRRQSWLMGFAIFLSLLPFSFLFTGGKIYWVFRESPTTAIIYGLLGIVCWAAYFLIRRASGILSNP